MEREKESERSKDCKNAGLGGKSEKEKERESLEDLLLQGKTFA